MNHQPPRHLYPWFVALGLLCSGLVVAAFFKDQSREWKDWQREYRAREVARATNDTQRAAAARLPIEIKQIVLPELGHVDRCVTCHLTVEDPSYAGMEQPLAYHPAHDQHPFQKFGCTICHQGQGRATTREAAHGHVKHWEQPMLPREYLEASCAKCHLPDDIPSAPRLARGRELFKELGCIGCHKLHGVGVPIGPELDTVGTHRSAEWLRRHFRDPAAVVPGSSMPPLTIDDRDVEQLTLYMLSLTGDRLSDYYVSLKNVPGPELGQRLFNEKGCLSCHQLGGKGGTIGPALDGVGQRREAAWIIEHFRDPRAVAPNSAMPQFRFTEYEIRALTEFLLSQTDPQRTTILRLATAPSPVERGRAVYTKYGCNGCHGADGVGGVPNPNAKSDQLVPGLTHLGEMVEFVGKDLAKEDLKHAILEGQREVVARDETQPPPPLYMPGWRGRIAEGELDDLAEYILSLTPGAGSE